jgi:hypothetical protein
MPKKETVKRKIGRKSPKASSKRLSSPVSGVLKDAPAALHSCAKKRFKKPQHQIPTTKEPVVLKEEIRRFIFKFEAQLTEIGMQNENVHRVQKEVEAVWNRYTELYDSISSI